MSDLERQLGDMLADGTITERDAEEVRTFAEFLAIAGPPDNASGQRGQVAKRLVDAGRDDLVDWALGRPAAT